jgi:hypothetical protein
MVVETAIATRLSEDEIREAVAKAWDAPSATGQERATEGLDQAVGGVAIVEARLWGDLRPSEDERLTELVSQAMATSRKECRRVITEAVVAALVRFATEYPDAPRKAEVSAAA